MTGSAPELEYSEETREWMPGAQQSVLLNVAGVVIFVVSFIAWLMLYAVARGGETGFEISGSELLVASAITLVIVIVSLALHEWIHGLAIRRAGGTPIYGAKLIGRVMPVLYCTSEDQKFTRKQFIVIALAPLLVLTIVFAVLIAFLPFGGWFVFPAALHTGGCVGDVAMAWIVLRAKPGTLVEDRIAGLRLYPPTHRHRQP